MKNAYKPAIGRSNAPVKHQQKKAPILTPEEKAKFVAEQVKAAAEAKAERERIELFGKAVEKMSHRQLRGELRRSIRREYAGKPPEPQAGLTIALGTIFLAVLDNTKTAETNLRRDQINPTAIRTMNPGW